LIVAPVLELSITEILDKSVLQLPEFTIYAEIGVLSKESYFLIRHTKIACIRFL